MSPESPHRSSEISDFQSYTEMLEQETQEAYSLAEKAREQYRDPEKKVDIPVAEDLAAKSVGLVTADRFPELEGEGVEERIRELEKEYGKNDERVALVIGKEIARGDFHQFGSKEKAVDAGLRIGLSYMTGGIVTAPLEGVAEVDIRTNDDGSEYLAVYYAGPIRSAGGTASAMSVLLADYIRKEAGLDRFKPSKEEVERYATEVEDYFTRVTKKQYTPERDETRMIVENVPVEVTGTPTEVEEVSNYKDLARVETNRIRGGMCLVYLDGIPLKASKLQRRIESFGREFGLEHWKWVEEYLEVQEEIHSSEEKDDEGEKVYEPSDKFLGALTAGRPVFAHPGRRGGFRPRYGRSRTAGLAALSFHPATMEITDGFMAIGTQLKTEYPGKATVSTPCDSIEPPVVRLEDGSVVRVGSRERARELREDIDEIIFMGDVLIPYGEFLENGKKLLPSPYVEEWWVQDLEGALGDDEGSEFGEYTDPEKTPNVRTAIEISAELGIPLHPAHTFYWDNLDKELVGPLHAALHDTDSTEIPLDNDVKEALEQLYVEHSVTEGGIEVSMDDRVLFDTLLDPEGSEPEDFEGDVVAGIEAVSGISVREQAPVFLGNRMGRPEKAERRTLTGKPQLLFPCGREEGGRMRNLSSTYEKVYLESEAIANQCRECDAVVPFSYCPYCGGDTRKIYRCPKCGSKTLEKSHCGRGAERSWERRIEVKELMDAAMDNLGIEAPPELLKSPRGVTGQHRHVEPLEKGLLREKYGLYVNKDGTVRYDATDVPLTHFRPAEIGVPVEKLRDMGYRKDVNGEDLERDDQLLELKYQDIIIPDNDAEMPASEYMLRAAGFVDELLEKFYGLPTYYGIEEKEDLVGELVVGLAPHTSGGVVGRVIGFTGAKCIYAHPFWHAAKRRNADGDEDSIILLMDALLNFSRQFLPDKRGTRTMDAPLILSTVLHPDEVDDESWNVDVVDQYPREFYEATQEFVEPEDVEVETAESLLGRSGGFYCTHTTSDMHDGPYESNYVSLGEMTEKVREQLSLGRRIKAVDEDHVAELLLDKHFLPDIKGNLRSFSEQRFRCVDCNKKYRRVPLKGRCGRCGGKLLLTISEGTIRKYLVHSEEIADSFAISPYLRQQIMMLKRNIESLFGKDDRQSSLGQFVAA